MAAGYVIFNVVFWFVFSTYYNNSRVKGQVSNEVKVFAEGDTMKQTCWSMAAAEWLLPANGIYTNYSNPQKDGRLRIERTTTEGGFQRYLLTIRNLSYTDTGMYTCHLKNDARNSRPDVAYARRHIFVSNNENGQVFLHRQFDDEEGRGRISPYFIHRDTFIGCLTSRPYAIHRLEIAGINRKNFTYYPKKGFLVEANTVWLEETRVGYCIAYNKTSNGSSNELTEIDRIKLLIAPIAKINVETKNIIAVSTQFPYVGGSLNITCTYPLETLDFGLPLVRCYFEKKYNGEIIEDGHGQILYFRRLTTDNSRNYFCACRHLLWLPGETIKTAVFVDVQSFKGRIFEMTSLDTPINVKQPGESLKLSVFYRIWPEDERKTEWFHQYVDVFGQEHSRLLINESQSTGNFSFVKIDQLRIENSGVYRLRLTAGGDLTEERTFLVSVLGYSPAELYVRSNDSYERNRSLDARYLELNKVYEFYCVVNSTLSPAWRLYWCPFGSAAIDNCRLLDPRNSDTKLLRGDFQSAIVVRSNLTNHGQYRCYAQNSSWTSEASLSYTVTDITNAQEKQSISIDLIDKSGDEIDQIYENENVNLRCRYQPLVYDRIGWLISDPSSGVLRTPNDAVVTIQTYQFSNALDLTFRHVKLEHSGVYACRAYSNQTYFHTKYFNFTVGKRVDLTFGEETSPSRMAVSDSMKLRCQVFGEPTPNITWLKDRMMLSNDDPNRNNRSQTGIRISDDGQMLIIDRFTPSDQGNYECVASNRFDQISKSFHVYIDRLTSNDQGFRYVIVLIALGLAILLLLLILVPLHLRRRRKQKKSLAVQMSHLQEIYLELRGVASDDRPLLEPDQPVNKQAERLPYDPSYEIPMDQLVLGNLLGEGNFGCVYEAHLTKENTQTLVAVKTPKIGICAEQQKALLSEFKIMCFVGENVNVLKVLGIVTKRITEGRLYVAVEYCQLGCLGKYLLSNKSSYLDEVVLQNDYENSTLVDGYLLPNSARQDDGAAGKFRYRSEIDDAWDAVAYSSPLSTRMLLSFAFQVANGMRYLSSKKVIHRDLALRNVLLTDDHVVKVSDFGLARNDYAYRAKTAGPLPVKWMAIESLLYQEYTEKSDVWSFGVVLWEIFSLGQTPYPGQTPDLEFIRWLKQDNNRMATPDYAPERLYEIMCQCWMSNPGDRPNFSDCRQKTATELAKCSKKYFKDIMTLLKLEDEIDELISDPVTNINYFGQPVANGMLSFNVDEEYNDSYANA